MADTNAMDTEFTEVKSGGWAKFEKAGDEYTGVLIEKFEKEARDQFGAQIVAVIENKDGTVNVGLPASNPMYLNGIKKMPLGHNVRIRLEGFYNSDTGTLVDQPGKTKKGSNYAKSYKLFVGAKNSQYQSSEEISVEDLPF